MTSEENKGEYIVEFQQHGTSVKVSVMDTATMTEVSIVGPSSAGQEELKRAALQKLHYVLGKKNRRDEAPTPVPPAKKPGIIV